MCSLQLQPEPPPKFFLQLEPPPKFFSGYVLGRGDNNLVDLFYLMSEIILATVLVHVVHEDGSHKENKGIENRA